MKLVIPDEAAMLRFGALLADGLDDTGAVHISGGLGAGKTTLCRGLLRRMGHEGAVKSPTFTLVEPYSIGGRELYHFDLYRLQDPGELDYIGVDEYFGAGKICLVEWPGQAEGRLPAHDLEIAIDVCGKRRKIHIRAITPLGETICRRLEASQCST